MAALSEQDHEQAMLRIGAGLKILMEATSLGCRKDEWYRFSTLVRLTDDNVDLTGVQLETVKSAAAVASSSRRRKS